MRSSFFNRFSQDFLKIQDLGGLCLEKSQFFGFLSSVITIKASNENIINSFSLIVPEYVFYDLTFCNFQGVFYYVFFLDNPSISCKMKRCRLENLIATPSSTLYSLIYIKNGYSGSFTGLCIQNLTGGYGIVSIDSYINPIRYGSYNYSTEFRLTSPFSSWIGGTTKTTIFNNNFTFATSNSQSGIVITTCNNDIISQGCSYMFNKGSTSLCFDPGGRVPILKNQIFYNNSVELSWFSFRVNNGNGVFDECEFFLFSHHKPFLSGDTILFSSLTIRKCLYDVLPTSYQSQVFLVSNSQKGQINFKNLKLVHTDHCYESISYCPTMANTQKNILISFLLSALILR